MECVRLQPKGLEAPNGLNLTDRISITLSSAKAKMLAAVCVSARPLTSLGNERRASSELGYRPNTKSKGDDPTLGILVNSEAVIEEMSKTITLVLKLSDT